MPVFFRGVLPLAHGTGVYIVHYLTGAYCHLALETAAACHFGPPGICETKLAFGNAENSHICAGTG